jgi:hypothetical protein
MDINQNRQVLFCATGGFKAETAYSTLLGMILGKPIFYIHENHRNLLNFQLFPIVLNYSRVIMYFDHLFNLQWERDEHEYQNYVEIWNKNPEGGVKENMELFIEETPEGNYRLNLAGITILEILMQMDPFSGVNNIIENMIDDLRNGEEFEIKRLGNFQIDWNKSGGHPPKPAGWNGVNPLKDFLRPIIERNFINEIKSQVGGIETNPQNIKISTEHPWNGYLPNNGGGHVQIMYHHNTLVLTITFNGHFTNETQNELERQLNTEIDTHLREILQGDFARDEIQINLPDNYLGPQLLDKLIELVNEQNQ